ncbi:MAG: Crp/Fnr family transcriptional regulator [Sphingobacterium sp.]|jgi:CRP-like cAMP-binding protein|nr:Crp/Fnr family transcriptional regulator [Sphingobacterium sp.]
MLRTNHSFLSYIEERYKEQLRKEDIIVKHYVKGERLLTQSEKATKLFFVMAGITKCFFTEENGKSYILEFLGKGEVIGEIELIRDISCLCTVEAMTDVTVYAITPNYFSRLLQQDIGLSNLLLEVFAERIVNTASRASYQQLYTIEHSLKKLLELEARQEIRIPKEDIASYLGVSIRSLNRVLKSEKLSL